MTDGRPQAGDGRDFTPADYNTVTANAKLIAVTLLKSTVEIKPEFFDPSTKKKLGYDTDVMTSRYDSDEGSISAFFRFAVDGKVGRKTQLKIYAEYLVVYASEPGLNQDAAEAFCEHVGLYASYPYFRAWVSQAASAGNLRLPPLPSLSSVGRLAPGLRRKIQKADA